MVTAATLAFKREAEAVLRQGGYAYERRTGKEHGVWKHPDPARPAVLIPSTPKNSGRALMHIRRAVRTGSLTHVPQGLEQEMPRKAPTPNGQPLHELLVKHATPAMKKRASELDRGLVPSATASAKDLGEWLRKCIQSHGAIHNSDLNKAAELLHLKGPHLSAAREAAHAKSFRTPGGGRNDFTTDFAGRVPPGAFVPTGRLKGSKNANRRPEPVTVIQMDQPQPNAVAALDKILADHPDTTPDPVEALERVFAGDVIEEAAVTGHYGGYAVEHRGDFQMSTVPGFTNGNGKRSQLDAAMELLREAALADTHALTDADLLMLRGFKDNLVRLRSDLDGMAAGIERLLGRVATPVA